MVQPFYIDTTGAWVLGHNQKHGAGSILQAGARAELIATPLTQALSTFGGRVAAQTMQFMFKGNIQAMLNYVAFRPYAVKFAIEQALGKNVKEKIVLDPAGGHSPVFYWLAEENKYTQFIEMDIPKVITNKKRVLKPLGIPPNLHLEAVDLSEKNLHEVQLASVDVIVTLGAYLSHAEYRSMLGYLRHTLKPDGHIIVAFPYREGIENFQENGTVFSRIVTTPKGVINEEKDIYTIFKDTDFSVVDIIKLSDLAKKQGKSIPADIELFAIAKLGDAPNNTVSRATRKTRKEKRDTALSTDKDTPKSLTWKKQQKAKK